METTAWAGTMMIMTAAAGSGYSLFSSAATKTMDAANLSNAIWRALKARHYFNNYM